MNRLNDLSNNYYEERETKNINLELGFEELDLKWKNKKDKLKSLR